MFHMFHDLVVILYLSYYYHVAMFQGMRTSCYIHMLHYYHSKQSSMKHTQLKMLHMHVSVTMTCWDRWCTCLWNEMKLVEAKPLGCYSLWLLRQCFGSRLERPVPFCKKILSMHPETAYNSLNKQLERILSEYANSAAHIVPTGNISRTPKSTPYSGPEMAGRPPRWSIMYMYYPNNHYIQQNQHSSPCIA